VHCIMVNRKFVDRTSNTKEETDKEKEEVDVHHVPFKVEYEGPANVDVKFTGKSVTSGDSSVLINQFRGRPLHGEELKLPKNFEGVVASDLKGSSEDTTEDSLSSEGAEISLVKKFDSMTYWNWDRLPSGMDKHVKLIDWLELSEVLHEPIQNSCD